MPCNSVATIAIALKVGTLESLAGNADALQAFQSALEQITRQQVRVQLSGTDCYFVLDRGASYRYVLLSPRGLELYGTFSAQEQAAIKAFLDALPAAMAEQALVNALATQLQLLDDQPTYDEQGQQVGRMLVVRV